jgi:hypothetical protein
LSGDEIKEVDIRGHAYYTDRKKSTLNSSLKLHGGKEGERGKTQIDKTDVSYRLKTLK